MAVKDRGYPYIVAWGKMMGSDQAYIRDQVEKAAAMNAPQNATNENSDGSWSTTDDIASNRTRAILGLDPLPPSSPLILRGFDAHVISQEQALGLDNYLYRIRFPSLASAASWVTTYKIAGHVTLIGAEGPSGADWPREGEQRNPFAILKFDQPVTIEYLRDQ